MRCAVSARSEGRRWGCAAGVDPSQALLQRPALPLLSFLSSNVKALEGTPLIALSLFLLTLPPLDPPLQSP